MKYFGYLKVMVKRRLAYRARFFISIFINPIYFLVQYFLWKAVYSYNNAALIRGFTFNDMMVYHLIQIFLFQLSHVHVDWRMGERVRYGLLTSDFIKPISYFFKELFNEIGSKVSIIWDLPVFLIGIFIFSFKVSFLFLIISIISFFAGFLINFGFSFLFGLSSFWTKRYSGIGYFKNGMSRILSGKYAPINLFPNFIQNILFFLPFPYINFIPVMILLGKYDVLTSFFYLGIQGIWIVLIYFICKIGWKLACKKFQGVGI